MKVVGMVGGLAPLVPKNRVLNTVATLRRLPVDGDGGGGGVWRKVPGERMLPATTQLPCKLPSGTSPVCCCGGPVRAAWRVDIKLMCKSTHTRWKWHTGEC